MEQIGRKIYYELATGNVLVDTGERQGDVVKTTTEQDFSIFTALQDRVQDTIGCIQLEYDAYSIEFATCYGYHVDTATKTLVFTTTPPEATLEQAKVSKIAYINQKYQEALKSGFFVSPKGTEILFGYDDTDRSRLMGYLTSIGAGIIVDPMTIQYKGKGDAPVVDYTITEFRIIGAGALQHEQTLTWQQDNLINQVNACTTVSEVNAVDVVFS